MKQRKKDAERRMENLPLEVRTAVDQMLIEGATFQEVADAASGWTSRKVAAEAVAAYLRSNPGLQEQRFRRQMEIAAELTRLAKAALEPPPLATPAATEAGEASLGRRNQQLRAQVALLGSRKTQLETRIRRIETQLKLWKWELMRRKFHDFENALANPEGTSLPPAASAKLQEIAKLLDLHHPARRDDGRSATGSA